MAWTRVDYVHRKIRNRTRYEIDPPRDEYSSGVRHERSCSMNDSHYKLRFAECRGTCLDCSITPYNEIDTAESWPVDGILTLPESRLEGMQQEDTRKT